MIITTDRGKDTLSSHCATNVVGTGIIVITNFSDMSTNWVTPSSDSIGGTRIFVVTIEDGIRRDEVDSDLGRGGSLETPDRE
jgi:hypothetical protein